MRKLLLAASIVAVTGAGALAASAGGGVATTIKVTDATLIEGSTVGVFVKLKSQHEACIRQRTIALVDAGDDNVLDKHKARDGVFVGETDEVGEGDAVYAKAKKARFGDGDDLVICAKARSKAFELENLQPHD